MWMYVCVRMCLTTPKFTGNVRLLHPFRTVNTPSNQPECRDAWARSWFECNTNTVVDYCWYGPECIKIRKFVVRTKLFVAHWGAKLPHPVVRTSGAPMSSGRRRHFRQLHHQVTARSTTSSRGTAVVGRRHFDVEFGTVIWMQFGNAPVEDGSVYGNINILYYKWNKNT